MITGWLTLGTEIGPGMFAWAQEYGAVPFTIPSGGETGTSIPRIAPNEPTSVRLTHAMLHVHPPKTDDEEHSMAMMVAWWLLPPVHMAGQAWPGHLSVVTIDHRIELALARSVTEDVSMEIKSRSVLGVIDQQPIHAAVPFSIVDGRLVPEPEPSDAPHDTPHVKRGPITIG